MKNLQMAEPRVIGDGDTLDVVDIWPSIQGEGPFAGCPAVFIRLAGCILQCPACDTDYTTDREQIAVDEIIRQARQFRRRGLVVITGGEPYRQPIQQLVVGLFDSFSRVQVETNGIVFQSLPKDTTIVCSPKTATIHAEFPHVAKAFKYVLSADAIDPDDGLPTSVLGMPGRPYRPPEWYQGEIYVQPADEGDAEKNKRNVEACVASAMKFGYRVSVQLHKILGVP